MLTRSISLEWYILKTCCRRLENLEKRLFYLQPYIMKMCCRCLENVLKMSLQDILNMFWRCLKNALKTFWRGMTKANIFLLNKIPWRHLQKVFWRRMAKVNIFILIMAPWRPPLRTKTKDVFRTFAKTGVCWDVTYMHK